MAIDLATGFNIGSKDAIDERQVLTLEQMKNLDESIYPDKYFAICKDNGKLYIYDASNEVNDETGKFRVLEGNVTGDSTVVEGARYYTLDEVDLSYYYLLAKINFGDKTSFSGKMTFMFNHPSAFKKVNIPFTEKKEIFFNHKEGKKFNYVMHSYPVINPAISTAVQGTYFKYYHFRGILTENNEFYLFLYGMLNNENYIHNFYIEYIGDGSIEKTFEFDDGSTNPYTSYGWSASKWYTEEGISENTLIQPSFIELPDRNEVVIKSMASKVYSGLSELGCDSSAALTLAMYKLYPSQALFCDVTEFSNYQTLFPYEEEADAESRIYILCIERETNYYLRWERKDGTKQAICYNNDRLGQPIVWNMIVGGGTVDLTGYAKTFTSLTELGLTADATIDDVISALKDGETAIITTNEFTNYLTMFPNYCDKDQYAILKVEKKNGNRCFIEWRQKDGNAYAIGGLKPSNMFSDWNNLVRFKKDGFADDSIVCIGETASSDGVIQTLENLGFSNDILTWDTGVYRVSHISGLINLPSGIIPTAPSFRLEHHDCKKWGSNHNPNTNTWAVRHSVLYAEQGGVYHRYYESGNTAGVYANDTGWQQIHTKKEDDGYIPDMYDRNANGDIPVVGFDRLAYSMCLIQNTSLLNNGDVYDEDYVGGWVYTMANDILIKDKEMFNKIKVVISIPGVLRIGIVNDNIFGADPRYSTCLVKWLVADFVAFTGMKEYDIADTVLEEGQYIFIECRQGESSWYYNQGSTAVTQGKVTYPASSCTSGLNPADKLDSTTNNVVFKSQSVTSKSAIFTFSGEINVGSKLRTNFLGRGYDNTARDTSDVKSYTQTLMKGGLNVGLYRRTKYSDTRFCKCVENCDAVSIVGNGTSYTKLFASVGQEALEGKSVYAFKLDVNTIGNITIYHMKGTTKDTVEIIDKYTHYVRAKGLQTIHLPFDIKLGKGEYIGFGGIHCKSTSDNIVQTECKWHYKYQTRVSWMNTYDTRQTGFYNMTVDLATYPERFTEFSENTSYLNIELICRGEKRSPLEDKYISFTGDSITTFAGFCTKQADVPAGNPAGDNAVYYPASGRTVNNVDATWWGILAKDNRMQILRNDAWSGSRVSSSTGSTDTKCLCGTERYKFLENSSQGTNVTFPYGEPEIVINMIGTNDLSGNVELGDGILYGLSSPTEDDYKKLYNAYSLMCQRLAGWYNRQGGKVVHFIIPRGTGLNTYANSNGDSIQKVALEFEKIAKSWGHYFIPLSYFAGFNMALYKNLTCPTSSVLRDFRSSSFNGSDGLHPNVIGMEVIADGVHRFLCSIM